MSVKSNYLLTLLLLVQLVSIAQKGHKKPIRVLIIDGYSNHDWKQTSALAKGILEESKLFAVDISTAPATTNEDSLSRWDPDFKKYDVIIQNTNNINDKSIRWPRKEEI